MSLTVSTRTTITTGITLLAGGLAAGTSGAIRGETAHSIGGACLTTIALTLIALTAIRTWIINTRHEREDLAIARREAEAQERKYFALQAALESEMGRLNRDMNAERARIAQTLIVEREAMENEFERRRLEVTKEAFREGVYMERAGLLKPDAPTPANLIQFPGQQDGDAPERERSREHGVVGP